MKHDSATKEYFNDNVRFADIVNFYLFKGRNVVKENQLRSIDTNYAALGVEKTRDIVKEVIYDMTMKTDGRMDYIIVGIENQSYIDYGMVVRTLLYDGLAYHRQMKEIKQGRKEFNLGELRKTDRLNPVITIVIYYGEEKWNGKKNLRDLVKCPIELKEYIPEYKLHLLEVYQLREEELKRFHTNVQKVFQFIQLSKEREKMKKLLNEDEYYKRVDVESARFMSSMTNLGIEIKGRESIDMCKAFMEEKELGIKEGIILGIKQGREEGLEAGIQQGLEAGIQQGLETGRQEGAIEVKKEIVRNLHSNHIDIETIMKVTSLTEEEVCKILN